MTYAFMVFYRFQLMTPEQAWMILELPATPEEIAERSGIGVQTVNDYLDDLYRRGVIIPSRLGFQFVGSIGQFHDAVLTDPKRNAILGPEFFDIWQQFWETEMGEH